jgi:hypothetical protein
VELTGNVEAMGYNEIKKRLAALSTVAANRQADERKVLNYRDGYVSISEFMEEE